MTHFNRILGGRGPSNKEADILPRRPGRCAGGLPVPQVRRSGEGPFAKGERRAGAGSGFCAGGAGVGEVRDRSGGGRTPPLNRGKLGGRGLPKGGN